MASGWIGVDLDGSLAFYDEFRGVDHIGAPIPAMVERVKRWVAQGWEVRVFTARVCDGLPETRAYIEAWCQDHLGMVLPVTHEKDYHMAVLFDDRTVTLETNTGRLLAPVPDWLAEEGFDV